MVINAWVIGACRLATPPQPQHRPDARRAKVITLLTLNDFHGQFSPVVMETTETPSRSFEVGGAHALLATIHSLRRQIPNETVLLDGGDMLQGELVANEFEGAPVLALYKLMGVDAAAVGNHEFDYGPIGATPSVMSPQTDPRGALKAYAARASFQLLSANIANTDGSIVKWPNVRPGTILSRGGVRFGIVGLTTLQTAITTLPENVKGLRFLPLLDSYRKTAAELKAAGAQILVLLAHIDGSCENNNDPQSCKGELFDLINALTPGELNIAVTGHAHTCMWRRHRDVIVVQACSRGNAIGRVDVAITADGQFDSKKSAVFPPTAVCPKIFSDTKDCEGRQRTGAPSAAIIDNPLLRDNHQLLSQLDAQLRPFTAPIREKQDRVLGQLPHGMRHFRQGHSPLGRWMVDIVHKLVPDADVALFNAGGIRGELTAGPLTYGQLYRIFPFSNRLATVKLTGAELTALLQLNLATPRIGWLQVSGLKLQIDCSTAVSQLRHVFTLQGRPIDPARYYQVVLSDFLLTGGDGTGKILHSIPSERKKIFDERLIQDELVNYVAQHHDVLSQTPKPSVQTEGQCAQVEQKKHRPICR